jgi:2,4-dienoyl-CoA reductase-like NADH-dependent reductase (Old Yellow Enzyme family)
MSGFDLLSHPLNFGALRLKNRIAHAAILTRYAMAERATDRLIAYHENRAKGGAAMIVTEAVNALPSQAGRGAYLNAHSDSGLIDLERLANAVTRHDCRILAQIQERGRGNYSRARIERTFAPSALPDDLTGAVPHALSTGEVEAMIEAFADATRRLQRAGFDGVEISAGHGHLFHQFLSAHSNQRADRFGGDLAGRMTLLLELISAIRAECGREFVLGLKLPAEDGDGGRVVGAGPHAAGSGGLPYRQRPPPRGAERRFAVRSRRNRLRCLRLGCAEPAPVLACPRRTLG